MNTRHNFFIVAILLLGMLLACASGDGKSKDDSTIEPTADPASIESAEALVSDENDGTPVSEDKTDDPEDRPAKKDPKPKSEEIRQVPLDKKEDPKTPPRPEPEKYTDTIEMVKTNTQELIKESRAPQVDHAIWDELLDKYVDRSGVVDYQGFQSNEKQLDNYLQKLGNTKVNTLSSNGQLAFWINAYNAFTVRLILDHYPVNSIMDIKKGKPWDYKWIKIDGRTLSLNQIEHEIIRPQFGDARIHFAVNCAARSCPPLLNEAYTADNVENRLERQTRSFINNTAYNQLSADNIKVSKLFDWYADDFGKVIAYINRYANTKVKPGAQIQYMDYDWQLNKQ